MIDGGRCRYCDCVATARHMFSGCPLVSAVWEQVDRIGALHWGEEYRAFRWDEIPNLVMEYEPVRRFKLSALWALWLGWLEVWTAEIDRCFNIRLIEVWVNQALMQFKRQLMLKVIEAPAVIAWLKKLQQRAVDRQQHRMQEGDAWVDGDQGKAPLMPEKEFLFTQCGNPLIKQVALEDSQIKKWVGLQHFLKVSGRKLMFQHSVWREFDLEEEEWYNEYGAELPYMGMDLY